jgi:hypothetical protein
MTSVLTSADVTGMAKNTMDIVVIASKPEIFILFVYFIEIFLEMRFLSNL